MRRSAAGDFRTTTASGLILGIVLRLVRDRSLTRSDAVLNGLGLAIAGCLRNDDIPFRTVAIAFTSWLLARGFHETDRSSRLHTGFYVVFAIGLALIIASGWTPDETRSAAVSSQ